MLDEAQKWFGGYTQQELQDCVVFVKQTWFLAKSTQSFSRFDAVNSKFDKQVLVNLRALWPPSVTPTAISGWFYPKESAAESTMHVPKDDGPEPMELGE